ncbi:hypothetical protein D0X99_05705 [Algoriphagus lacus]|uniref:Uncharacterized protein n=1 Tax=Algoriphagus lacus TaxID=2056311 RepID=A0A418PUI9_9BACT|nr:hypothetical protein [Algoriphagus lacus]RIW17241.1 hypothetical protein D0X99_05705 [Algoriphagus lacus]
MILLILALPAFGLVYLYQNSGNINWNLPQMSGFFVWFLAGFTSMILAAHYVLFHQKIKLSFSQDELLEKVKTYCAATERRFLILFLVSILATVGLLLSKNPIFTVIFAVTLVFFSLGKPSPDRMARLMRLKKEDRELIREASRPDQSEI